MEFSPITIVSAGFCFFEALERKDLVLRFTSTASTLASVIANLYAFGWPPQPLGIHPAEEFVVPLTGRKQIRTIPSSSSIPGVAVCRKETLRVFWSGHPPPYPHGLILHGNIAKDSSFPNQGPRRFAAKRLPGIMAHGPGTSVSLRTPSIERRFVIRITQLDEVLNQSWEDRS